MRFLGKENIINTKRKSKMITLKIKVGSSMLEYEAEDIKKIHKFASLYGALPQVCDCCGKPTIYLNFKSPKDNDYYGIKCSSCGAELTFHQLKEGGFYTKAGEMMEQYKPKTEVQPSKPAQGGVAFDPFGA